MHAQRGDWLILDARRGYIEEVHSADGSPPYLVRWLETGHESLVFPGPDALVQTHGSL